jgi:drug/metabolite transporter (DMT)-like permease
MKYVSLAAFIVVFLSALFLFMRNYPSDRWFSVAFVVAGGVLLWCAWGVEAESTGTKSQDEEEAPAPASKTTSVNTNTD